MRAKRLGLRGGPDRALVRRFRRTRRATGHSHSRSARPRNTVARRRRARVRRRRQGARPAAQRAATARRPRRGARRGRVELHVRAGGLGSRRRAGAVSRPRGGTRLLGRKRGRILSRDRSGPHLRLPPRRRDAARARPRRAHRCELGARARGRRQHRKGRVAGPARRAGTPQNARFDRRSVPVRRPAARRACGGSARARPYPRCRAASALQQGSSNAFDRLLPRRCRLRASDAEVRATGLCCAAALAGGCAQHERAAGRGPARVRGHGLRNRASPLDAAQAAAEGERARQRAHGHRDLRVVGLSLGVRRPLRRRLPSVRRAAPRAARALARRDARVSPVLRRALRAEVQVERPHGQASRRGSCGWSTTRAPKRRPPRST